MMTMGCAICRVKQTILKTAERSLDHESERCQIHPERVLVDWADLESRSDDRWLGIILNQRYELVRPLGQGGFGSVYLGVQRGHIRHPVAIKLLTRESPEYLTLFRDEMRVVSRLSSPHTVRYLDSGTHRTEGGRELTYMVMNLVEGETLAQRIIRDGALKPLEVTSLLIQLLSSLHEAHQLGIVHRDLKPLNLMVSQSDREYLKLVVLDFGVARVLEQASRDATRNRIMGTPYYLAPETLNDHSVGPLTDLFSAAVIAYESICCRSPFLNEDLSGIEPYLKLRKLYRANKSPEALPEHLSREWRLFFECALAIDPRRRFPDAQAMRIAVEELAVLERERELDNQITMHESGPTLMLPQINLDFEADETTTFFKRYSEPEEGEQHHRIPSVPPHDSPLQPRLISQAPQHNQDDSEESLVEESLIDLSEFQGPQTIDQRFPHGHFSAELTHRERDRIHQADTEEEASLAPSDIRSKESSVQPPATPYPIQYVTPAVNNPALLARTPPHNGERLEANSNPPEYQPTMQLSRAQFKDVSLYPQDYNAPERREVVSDSSNEQTGSFQYYHGTSSVFQVLIQITLMVGLGAGLAYIIIRYVIR